MDDRLEVMARSQFGAFGSPDAARVGVSPDELTTRIRRREVHRVRRGAYVLASIHDSADVDERYRMRIRAVLCSRPEDRASHQSALVMLGIHTYGVDFGVVEVESRSVGRRRKSNRLVTNPWTYGDTWRNERYAMVAPARACVQVAATSGFMAAVCAMDSALHLGRCTREEIRHAALTLPPIHRTIALRALEASDPRAESVGETRTRIVLRDAGFTVESQVELQVPGAGSRRVDFVVDGCVIVEFDGLVKYQNADGKHNLAEEKARETRLSQMGYEVVRVIWSDLESPQSIIREIRQRRALAKERRRAMRATTR